ncbi:MAG TPA: M48 family metallopeptidase [Drouetiella sp.]
MADAADRKIPRAASPAVPDVAPTKMPHVAPASTNEPARTLAEVRLPAVTEPTLRYSRIRYALFFFSIFYSMAAAYLIMQSGIAARLRDTSIKLSRNKFFQVCAFSVMFTLVFAMFMLPLSLVSGFYLEHAFALSDQSLSDFLLEKVKSIGVSAVLNTIALTIFFGIVKRFRVHWPLVLWAICIPVFALAIFAEPIIIDPIFNKFTPMADSSLKNRITALANKAKIPNAVILVADKSKQTNKMNAYVTGIGNSSRIVLWDSTVSGLPEDQVLSVVGHEIGHYVLNHIYWGFGIMVLATLLLVPFGYFGSNWFVSALPERWQVGSLSDYAITPVLLMLSLSVGFVSMPLFNYVSRYQEHQADKYGLELTDNRLAMANLFISFSRKNLSEPDPPALIKFFLFTHPTLKERIEFAAGRKVD